MVTLKRKVTLRRKQEDPSVPSIAPVQQEAVPTGDTPPPPSPPAEPNTGKNRWGILVVGVLVLGLGIGAYALWYKGGGSPQPLEAGVTLAEEGKESGERSAQALPQEEKSKPIQTEKAVREMTKGVAQETQVAEMSSPETTVVPTPASASASEQATTHKLQGQTGQSRPSQPEPTKTQQADDKPQGHLCLFGFDSEQALDVTQLKRWAREATRSAGTIVITSYADTTGDSDYNQALSQRRAEWVHNVLVSEGISPERIETRALGETESFGAKAMNRRADVAVR